MLQPQSSARFTTFARNEWRSTSRQKVKNGIGLNRKRFEAALIKMSGSRRSAMSLPTLGVSQCEPAEPVIASITVSGMVALIFGKSATVQDQTMQCPALRTQGRTACEMCDRSPEYFVDLGWLLTNNPIRSWGWIFESFPHWVESVSLFLEPLFTP